MTPASDNRFLKCAPVCRGFTLIELLVVIVIITILVSMLFLTLGMIRRSAKQVVCASNLRQIGTAVLMYSSDFKCLPPPVYKTNWTFGNLSSTAMAGGTPTAAAAVFSQGLIDTPCVFYCPAGSTINVKWWNNGNQDRLLPANLEWCYIGYCWWAGYSFALGPNPTDIVVKRWDEGSKVLCSDMSMPSLNGFPTGSHLDAPAMTPLGGNVLYGDGRVAWVPFKNMSLRQNYFMSFYF